MNYTRIYTGPDGESHFEDVDIEMHETTYAPPTPPLQLSEPTPATAVAWVTLPAGWFGDWHPTPRVQWWFQLSGDLEVGVSDGEVRRILAGSVVRLEDVSGRGHTTRVISDEDVVAAYAHIPE